jgi:hypothetical protein
MIPEFTAAIFMRSLDEWGAYPGKFLSLPPDEQTAFLKQQGYVSLHDLLAHVVVWWEEGEAIIRDTIEKRERPRRKYDFDEFNAASLARFKDTPDSEFFSVYETRRKQMVALVSSLTDEQMKIRRVYGWLDAVSLGHLKEHSLGAPRFLALDMLQREWAGTAERFNKLTAEEQKSFLDKQGFSRFRDLAAHIIAWREDGLQVIDAISKDPAYKQPEMDMDAYNAQAVELFGRLSEDELWKKFELTRQSLIELVINLPEETYNHKDVQAWLRDDVFEHYFEHAL